MNNSSKTIMNKKMSINIKRKKLKMEDESKLQLRHHYESGRLFNEELPQSPKKKHQSKKRAPKQDMKFIKFSHGTSVDLPKKKEKNLDKAGERRRLKIKKNFKKICEDKRKLRAKIRPISEQYYRIQQSMKLHPPFLGKFFEIFHIIILNQLIYSKYFSKVFQSSLKENYRRIKQILSPDSNFVNIVEYLDPLRLTQNLNPSSVIIIAVLTNIALLMIIVNFWSNRCFLKKKKLKSSDKLITVTNFISMLISVIIANYQFFFYLLNIYIFSSFFCHDVTQVRLKDELTVTSTEISSDDVNLQAEIIAGNFNFRQDYENIKVNVPLFNTQIYCSGTPHVFLIIFSSILLLMNFYLMYLSNRITSFIPDIRIQQSKTTNYDFIMNILFSLCFLLLKYFESKQSGIKEYFVYFLALFLIALIGNFVLQKVKPYYSESYHTYKNLMLIYITLISGVSLALTMNPGNIILEEKTTFLSVLILMTFFIKMDQNRNKKNISDLYLAFSDIKKINHRDIQTLYYKITKYLSVKIKEEDGEKIQLKELEELKFLIIHLKGKHKSACCLPYCFCRRDPTFMEVNSLTLSSKIADPQNLLLEMMMVMELIFKSYFKYNQEPNKIVFFCHLDFLINYFGKPAYAYRLILLNRVNEVKITEKNKNKISIELGVLLLQLDRLGYENLRYGNLALIDYSRYFKNDDMLNKEDEGRINILDHVIFLENFEIMKKEIREGMKFKTKFLEELIKNDSKKKFKRLMDYSWKYYEKRQSVANIFETLKEISENHYSPIYCVYGHFIYEVCEDRTNGLKVLKRYDRILRNCNLNKMFSAKKGRTEECLIMTVQADTRVQKFVYVSSNIKKWLGWKVEETVGQPLDMIIPDPIAAIHRTFFDFDRTRDGGRMFMEKQKRNLVAINQEGFLVKGDLIMRFNINLSNSLQMAASFNLSLENEQVCILITEKNGKITALTKSASDLFQVGDNISDYNDVFSQVYEVRFYFLFFF